MPSNDTFGEIKGLPTGATVEPIVQSNGTIHGLPKGAVVEPISKTADKAVAAAPIAGLPKGATVHPVEQTPQEKIFQSTVSEGQSPERAQLRVNEYNYAVKQGLNPQRAEQFAQSLQWPDAPKQTITDEQKGNIYRYALQQATDFKSGKQKNLESHWLGESLLPAPNQNSYREHLNPEEYAKQYADGYAYAKSQGWSEGRAQQYAASNASARLASRVGDVVEPVWQSAAGWVAKTLGVHHPYERVVNPWVESDEQVRNDEFTKYKDLSWSDKVAEHSKWKGWLAKGTVGLDNGTTDLLGGLTSAQNLSLMFAGEAGGLAGATGFETPIAAQKAVRTVSKLANAGFMYQMASGTVQDAEQVVEAAKKGDPAEVIEFAVSGLGNAWMVKHGVDHARAEREVRARLDDKANEIFKDHKFSDLDTPKQAYVMERALNEDLTLHQAEELSEKQAKRSLNRIKYRYGIALQQSWNPRAAERAIRKLHADRAELREKQQESAQAEAIRKAVEGNKKAEAVKREKIISDNEAAKQRNVKSREERENETPRPQATESVPQMEVDGEVVYGPVTRLEQEAHIGVEPVGDGFGVYVQDKETGEKQYLNSSGYFGSEESAASVQDEESARTLAKIQALRTTAVGDEEKESHLGNVTEQLIGQEIDTRHAQDMTGIGGDERPYDEHDAAHGEGVEGPFVNGRAQYLNEFDEGYDKAGLPEEKKDASRAQAESSAWELTNENLNMLTRSGDRIVDRSGKVWELGSDGLLHGPNGREVPLTKNGLYSNQAMNMAAYGRVRYGAMPREERLSREEQDRTAQRAVASIDQELMENGTEPIPEDKLARVKDYSDRRRRERAEKTVPQEGEQGPEPDTEQSLINLLSQIGDAGWASNPEYAAGRLQEEADREGVPVESLVRQKLAGSDDPLARIAQLQPGNTIQDSRWLRKTWTVMERKNGDLYLKSGGAQHDLNPLNPSQPIRDIVGKGDGIKFNTPEQIGEAAAKPTWVENNQQAAQEVKERSESSVPEPRNEEEAKENVYAAEGRKESIVSEVVRATAAAFDVNAGTTEQDIDKRVQAAKEATDTLHLAVQQVSDAAGKAAPKGDYPRGGGILVVSRGDRTEVNKGKESHPAQYALMDVEAPVVSHRWNGNNLEDNEEYVPKEMQYRDFDENRTAELVGQSQPENYKYRLYFDSGYGPENGPAILDSYGRVIGGNTRLLRLKKWLENISRMGDTKARDAEMIVFNDAAAKFSAKVGIKHVPDDGRTYIPVRVLDKPIETVGEAARLGRLFNDRSSAQVGENLEALSNGKLLSEADAQERLENKPGILSEIGKRLAGNDISTVRAAIDDDPYWFAKKAKEYFHISDTENASWFDGVGEDATLSKVGKDKFVLSLVGSHISDVESVRLLSGTDAESALTKAIGTVTALRAYPDRDITEKVSEAVSAAAKTRRFRKEGDKPIPAWNHVYGNNDLYLGKPEEPSRVSQAIYVALLDSKTNRLNGALKDMIAGEPGMEMLFAPKVAGQELHTAADYFNVAFRPELEKIAKSQGRSFDPVTQEEFEAALQNREWVPKGEKKEEPKVEVKPEPLPEDKVEETPKFGPPPATASPESVADRKSATGKKEGFGPPPKTRSDKEIAKDVLLNQVREQGFVDRKGLKTFLETDPTTRENANWTMKNFQWVARAIWEDEQPEGVEGKEALDWLLERRKILGSVERDNYTERGRGRTEWDELGRAHVYLHKEADATTVIHELWHAFLPLLSDEDLSALNTIKGKTESLWDGKSRSKLVGQAFDEFSERAIGGIEKYYRDETPKDFSADTGKVLEKIKTMFQKVYKKWREDPLRPFRLTEKAKETLDRIFHVEGVERVTGIDRADDFMTETQEAERARKSLKKPSEVADPVLEIGKDIGASGKPEKFVSGTPEYESGEPVRIMNSVAYVFDNYDAAVRAVGIISDEIDKGSKRTDGADLVATRDGKYAVRINVKDNPKRSTLYQELPPESRGEMGVRLKQLKKEIAALPRHKILDKQFLQMRIEDLENRIGAEYGTEERAPKTDPELARQVMEEKKNERANRVREGADATSGIRKPPTVDRVSGKTELGVSRHEGTGGSTSVRGLGVDRVEPISMLPLREISDPVVGKTADDTPETEESWKKRTANAGMSTESPLPIWSLSPRTARILDDDKFPGQTPTVQITMSALQRGDGVVVANSTGTGKTWVSMAIVSEFGRDREAGDKPLTLYITRNRPLLEKTADEPAKSFGVELNIGTPNFGVKNGTYGVSYQAALRNPVYQNIKWDLVIADEAGEARNWFKKAENKKGMSQGQMLMAIMQNAKKGVYMSATPFHTPLEFGYLEKLGLWKKGGYEDWLKRNFKTYYKDKTLVAELDPAKMARLRQQLIQRGQMTSQAVSYDGFNAHFGYVPMTNAMKRGLDTISGLMERARTRTKLVEGLSSKSISAYEAQFTKAFLEREMLPQATEMAKKALDQGYSVIFASPTTDEDLFRKERSGDPTAFQQMDDSMNGQFSRLLPRLPNVFDALQAEFGERIGNYSGVNQSDTGREKVRKDFQEGTLPMAYMSIPAGGIGSDWHDTKGDKPRLMIVLGPPYSGVLLEQTLGRPWRFGTKSDVHVVFLGTDAAPQVRIMKQLVAPRLRSLRAAVHGIKDSLATAMENYSDVEKTRSEQDTMAFAMGNEIEVKAADFGVRHAGRVVGIDSWDAIEIPPAKEAMNKGMKTGEMAGGNWTNMYQDKEKSFTPPPSNLRAEKAINDVAESAAKNPDIPEETISLGAAQASEVADVAPEGIDPAAAGSYAMKASLEGNGFTYNAETGRWEAPFGVVEKMLGRDTSGIDEKNAKYSKLTIGMNFEQRALSAARKIGAEDKVRRVFNLKYDYDQAKEKYAGNLQMRLLHIFLDNKLNPNAESSLEKKVGGWLNRPERSDVRQVMDVVKGLTTSDNPRVNKAAEELQQWMGDLRDLMAKKGVHREDGSTFAEVPKNARYIPQITDWDAKLTDPKTGETRALSEIVGDQTLDDVAKLRFFEKTREELGAGVDSTRQWLRDLKIDREHKLNRPKNPNVTMRRTINHPFYKKDMWALMRYSDQVSSALALEETLGHDMKQIGDAIADVPSRKLRKDLKQDVDTMFEHQDWSTTMGKVVRTGQGFEALTKMALSPFSVAMHNIHAATNLGLKPWFTAQIRMLSHPQARMREKYYAGVVMIKMNPALLEGPRRGLAGKFFDVSGFSALYRWQRGAVAETAWAWMEQDALSDLKAGGKRAETSRRLLKDRLLMSDDEIDKALANNRWDEESKWKAERVFADKVAFSENTSQMPRTARLSMAENLSDAEKNLHAAARGAYMLQSFQIKTYSGMKEWLFDEVFQHHNYRPLLPLFLLYPAAGFVLMNLKGAAVGGIHRAFEGATGEKHTRDRWDALLEEYQDVAKHPWAGPLKLYLDSLLIGMANERIKRWTDIGMMAAMGQKKKMENMVQYLAVDELDQLVGGLYSDIFVAGLATPVKAWYDYLHTKNPKKKLKAVGRDLAKEAEDLAWPLRTIPQMNKWAGTKKLKPPPK